MDFPIPPHTLSVSKGQRAMMWMLQNVDNRKWKLVGMSVHLTLRKHICVHTQLCASGDIFNGMCRETSDTRNHVENGMSLAGILGTLVLFLVPAWAAFLVSFLVEGCSSIAPTDCQWGRCLPSVCAHVPRPSCGSGCRETLPLCVSGILSVLGCILSAPFSTPAGEGQNLLLV